jgi:hypothetical protein
MLICVHSLANLLSKRTYVREPLEFSITFLTQTKAILIYDFNFSFFTEGQKCRWMQRDLNAECEIIIIIIFVSEIGPPYVAQAVLELSFFLPQFPEC